MAKQEKKLTLNYFDKKVAHANRKEKFYMLNEDDEEVAFSYYPTFSKSKRDAIQEQLLNDIIEANDKHLDFFSEESATRYYLYYLTIRHFSDVKEMTEGFSVEEHFAVMRNMVDTEFLDLMIHEKFDLEEVSKVENDYNMTRMKLEKLNNQLEQFNTQKQAEINKAKYKQKRVKAVKN